MTYDELPVTDDGKCTLPCCGVTLIEPTFPIRCRCKQRVRGVGDLVSKATSAIGIKPCDDCKKRQAWLNRLFPFADANERKTNDSQPQ